MKSLLSDDSSTPARATQLAGEPLELTGSSTSTSPPIPAQSSSSLAAHPSLPSSANAHNPLAQVEPSEQDQTVISQRPVALPADFVRSLSLVELAKSLEGRNLHHFSVDRMIGGGGMGAVFRGRDLRLDREVAIKVIPESRRDPETLRRFRMEAQSAARLDHPNIARVYDIGEDEAWNYIVFEFIDGINLRDLVQNNGPMSIDDAVFTTRQVAEALQHAHDRDVVHRDIKPSNVIITPTGIAKVVDMGLARNTATDRSTADQTASGVTLGTFDYISPEQARDPRDADVRSDLYSLGCTLFFMLTGQPPFPEGTALQKLLNHGSQPPPDPRQWRDDISDQLAAVLSKLMAKRPVDRYQKPIELINDLLLIAQIESLPRSRSAGTIMMQPSIARRSLLETHLPWLIPLSVLIASAAWLQSADSWTAPLEIPQPNLQSLRHQAANSDLPATPVANPTTPRSPSPGLPESVGNLPSAETKRPTQAPLQETRPATEPPLKSAPRPETSSSDVPTSSAGPTKVREPSNSLASSIGTSVPAATKPSATAIPSPATPSTEVAVGSPTKADSERRTTIPAPASDVIRVGGAATESLGNLSRWAPNLPAALAQASMLPDIRVIELNESIEVTSAISVPRSGLTIRSAPGVQAEVVLSGADVFGLGWEAWIDVDRKFLRCQSLRIKCLNDMRQPQSIFTMRNGGRIELENCELTMLSSRDSQMGSCITIKEPARAKLATASSSPATPTVPAMPPTLMPATSPTTVMPTIMPGQSETVPTVAPTPSTAPPSASDDEPISIVARDCVVRGAMSLVTMRSVTRAEITIEKVCAMLEGRVLTIRNSDEERVPPVIRMSLQQSTFATQLGFLAVVTSSGNRAPLTLMRTARLCAFWSPLAVPHIAIDGLDNEELFDKLLLLRGEENAYDQNIQTLCQCRLADGQNIDFSLVDMTGEWYRELGNEHELRWLESVPPEQPMHEQLPVQYRLRESMFMPGYR